MSSVDTGIRLRRVVHTYGVGGPHAVTALRGVDLDVAPGEFVAVVGPNGSGKSTVAKHLNALLLPGEGDVWVDGLNTRDPGAHLAIRRRVGMVFQNPDNQIVGMTVEHDIAFGLENLGLPVETIEARIDEAVRLLGLQHLRREPPHRLSGGEKQRLAIASVVAMRPRYLVLDEATALLDPAGRAEVLDAIVRLHRQEGLAVVWITHFMEEAVHAQRVVVMDGGQVVLTGTPRQVFQQADAIRRVRLDVPLVTRIAAGLRARGLPVPAGAVRLEEVVEGVCRLRSGA